MRLMILRKVTKSRGNKKIFEELGQTAVPKESEPQLFLTIQGRRSGRCKLILGAKGYVIYNVHIPQRNTKNP